jgi:methyl-accepting chemotaxis protein
MKLINNLKVGTKIGLSFGLVVAIVLCMSAYTYVALHQAEEAEQSAMKSLALSEFLAEKRGDHLSYVKNLEESIILEKEFTGQLDPTQCSFGKWYATFVPPTPDIKTAYEKIDQPHRRLHKIAADIKAVQAQKGSQKEQIRNYETNVVPVLAEVEKGIKDLSTFVKERSDEDVKRSVAALSSAMTVFLALTLIASIVSILTSFFIVRTVVRPVRDLVVRIDSADLNTKFDVHRTDEIGELQQSFEKFITSIKRALFQVQDASTAVASASAQISSSTEQMASGSQQQTSQTDAVAAAVEQMTMSIKENSRSATQTAETAREAKEAAQQGGDVVRETIERMKRIGEVVNQSAGTVQALSKSSDQIGEIIGVIDDIANQTNLLALNAAIEAARAGEQGRGFAVVADEVRRLAERTTKATKEITEMIKGIQTETSGAVTSIEGGTAEVKEGIALAEKAGESLRHIVLTSENVREMIEQIAAANEEQARTSDQISKNVEAISNVTSETAQGTHQIAQAAEDLNRLTEKLQQLVAGFKLDANAAQRSANGVSEIGEVSDQTSRIAVQEDRPTAQQTDVFDIEAAKASHYLWRSRIQKLLAGKEHLEESQVASHRDCQLGKWYYDAGQQEFGSEPTFVELGRKHEEMHKAVRKTAALWNADRKNEARITAEHVYRLSGEVVGLLDELDKVQV